MKKINLIGWGIVATLFYWAIVIRITNHYYEEASFHYQMGSLHYQAGMEEEGKKDAALGEFYKQKGNRTLLWLPKFLRPKPVK